MSTIESAKKYIELVKNEIKNLDIKYTILKIENNDIETKSIISNGTNIEIKPIEIDLDTDDYLDKSIFETEK